MKKEYTNDTLLSRWLEGQLSENEAKELEARTDFQELKQAVEAFDQAAYPPMDLDASWEQLKLKTTQKAKPRRILPLWSRVAAVFALVAGIGLWYFAGQGNEHVAAAYGQNETISLPDGSSVTLNAGSSIDFAKRNWKNNRIVHLDGEAFFQVASGKQFTVQSNNGTTTVLGTEFDVYDRDKTLVVKCFEGKVKVVSPQAQEAIIEAGEAVKINDNQAKRFEVRSQEPHWMSGQLHFFEISLAEIFEELERQYILDVDSEHIDTSRQFTGNIPTHDLDKALAIVCGAMNLKFEKNGQNIKISPK